MTRKCSHCGTIGHNSRTCAGSSTATTTTCGSVRLFGVRISTSHSSPSTISKCLGLDCISSVSVVSSSPSVSLPLSLSRFVVEENTASVNESLSYSILPASQDVINKGVPWSEDEHKQFLRGLERLGKGDWRGISKHFVNTRTPTQVASHAQKYFLRQASIDDKKRRPSLFDMVENNNDQTRKRRNPIPTDLHLSRRRTASSSNQHLAYGPHPFDLSLGFSSNNAGHTSASSSTLLCLKHTPIDLDLTLASPRRTLQSSSSLRTMRVT